jgi:uncharacterized protein YwgA
MQIQKTLFVLGELHPAQVQLFYKFQPYHYGPFSVEVEEDLKALREEQLLDRSGEHSRQMWEITRSGLVLGATLSENIDKDVRKYLLRLTKWVSRVPQGVLLRAIYERFPAYSRQGSAVLDT